MELFGCFLCHTIVFSQRLDVYKRQQLDSFIELINSFSDAPELDSDAEYDVYYKDLFDQWRAGEAFPFIIEDASGALVIDDHSPEFTGGWQDSTSQRATMDITSDRGIYYNIEINWGSSAMENTVCHFTGTYDSKRNGIVYSSGPVSYTHLDVYKRQVYKRRRIC